MNSDRLNSVLRIRRIQERSARGEVASRRNDHRVAESAERRTWRLLDERMTAVSTRSVQVLLGERAAITAGMLAADTMQIVTIDAADRVEVAVVSWTIAARRVEGLERLAERAAVLEREESLHRTANEIDDLVLIRFAKQVA